MIFKIFQTRVIFLKGPKYLINGPNNFISARTGLSRYIFIEFPLLSSRFNLGGIMRKYILALLCLLPLLAFANPYPNPELVSLDQHSLNNYLERYQPLPILTRNEGLQALRVQIKWEINSSGKEVYSLEHLKIENSGTEALFKRVLKKDPHGSYQATIFDLESGKPLYYQSLGTGKEFRKLSMGLAFRFPLIKKPVRFVLMDEDPTSGKPTEVLNQIINPDLAKTISTLKTTQRLIRKATLKPKIVVAIYADGFQKGREAAFFEKAAKVVYTLEKIDFPKQKHFEFRAIFSPSNETLGWARDFGDVRKIRDSFLGLYHPYWHKFGRWYHVVYPTNVTKYRDGLAQSPYDYPIILIDSTTYWGVGNFKELTAIPSHSSRFEYLLLHELGHYFGLNEEYEGGGPTELEFAPYIEEPWSQNITFLNDPNKLKWSHLVSREVPIPTPRSHWNRNRSIGAYLGGYADSHSQAPSHKPGYSCIMSSGQTFCPVCQHALEQRFRYDQGE